jgi:adenylyltransferase/sulfurtransferase
MVYDALEMSYKTLKLRKDPNAEPIEKLIDYDAFCGELTEEAAEAVAGNTISVQQLQDWLSARDKGEKDFVLIDVREPVEREINQIPGSILLPKGDFQNGSAFPQLPQDKQVVLYCKVGGRSAEVLALVHGAGLKDAVHVGGGVAAWVSQIDPSQAAY